MMRLLRHIGIYSLVLPLVWLAGCQQSPHKDYYLLSAPQVDAPAPQGIQQLIGIGPIEIADYLKRNQMVFSKNNQALQQLPNAFWAEPLDKGIARVLALNLTRQDPARMLIHFPWRSDSRPPLSLRVQVHSLNLDDQGASIHATWELFDNHSHTSASRQHFIRRLECPRNPSAMAKAYGELLAQLAGEMDKALREKTTPAQP